MSTIGVQRRVTLAPAPDSARAARRLVSDVLVSARADEFTDSATLLTSELVTNGIVHAHTELHVAVEATATWVRVEVIDGNAQLPSRREYDESASTGRGMEMVELLADDFGVEPLPYGGKRVWFRLGAVPGTPAAAAEPNGHVEVAEPGDLTTTIHLLGLPVALYCAWQQHADALLREAALVALESGTETSNGFQHAGRALGALADAASGVFALRDHEVAVANVVLEVSSDAVPWFPILRDVLSKATAMAAVGRLLTPPSLPEIVAVRRWVCDETARQSAGLPPTAWAEQELDEPELAPGPVDQLDEVRASASAVVAADATNRIRAVSPAAAEMLGWVAADLEGRRLVTIIPQRLRDRHIAGFTRHLVEGTTRIIGRPVPLSVLCRDGTERDVMLLVEHRAIATSRGIFVATFTPM